MTGGCLWHLHQGFELFFSFLATDAFGNWSIMVVVPPGFDCVKIWAQGFLFPSAGGPFYQVTSCLEAVPGT